MTPVTKLNPKYYGHFPIVGKVGKVAYSIHVAAIGGSIDSSSLPCVFAKEINGTY